MIRAQDVHFTYRSGFWLKPASALTGVTFSVPKNSVFVLIGPNGAGKTTLIHLLAGLRRPSQGKVEVGGLNPWLPQSRRQIGFVPERPYFYDFLSGEKLLESFGKLSLVPKEKLKPSIERVLDQTQMQHARHKELRHYSKGMLQRIGIAQALIHDPDVLIFDEPFSGLDPKGQRALVDLILDLKSKGKTIFMTSHWLHHLSDFCTEFAAIRAGKIVEHGEIAGRSATDLEKFFDE